MNSFYQSNDFFTKSYLTINIVMLVSLETNFGNMCNITPILNYLHGHTVLVLRFNMGHQL